MTQKPCNCKPSGYFMGPLGKTPISIVLCDEHRKYDPADPYFHNKEVRQVAEQLIGSVSG